MNYYEFFISYNRKDAEIARKVSDLLSYNGIPCWFAESEILLHGRRTLRDENILKSILEKAAGKSKYCLYLLSNNSLNSSWVQDFEIPLFLKRETKGSIVFPLQIDAIEQDMLLVEFSGRHIYNCQSDHLLYTSLQSILKRLIIKNHLAIKEDLFRSKELIPIRAKVDTEKRRINYSYNTGIEWKPTGKLSKPTRRYSKSEGAVVFFAENALSGMVLNLIIGVDPDRTSNLLPTERIEEDNYFGAKFVEEEFLSWKDFKKANGVGEKMKFAWYYIKYKSMTALLPERIVVGSHVFNIMGSPHFAFTYFMGGVIYRKYSIYFTPESSKVSFEFVFTVSYQGSYEDFLPRISQVDSIVKSLRVTSQPL